MNILINASNVAGGGGPQVADSVCRSLHSFTKHHFIVVLPSSMGSTAESLKNICNIKLFRYDYPHKDYYSLITGRNPFLDDLVNTYMVECVLTIFGPMKWKPKCAHLCGFALSQIVMPESPYFTRMATSEKLMWVLRRSFWKHLFGRSTSLYTENPLITQRVQSIFPKKKVFTVTNYYNQVFDEPERWQNFDLPFFEGVQCLNITSSRPHKNLPIALQIAEILHKKYPDFKVRFVFTITENEFPPIPVELKSYFYFTGKVDIKQCPSLYNQCNIAFQPTLLECFTATYPEAMVMKKPIVTPDLEFARGLCGDAALYYSALSATEAAEGIFKIAHNEDLRSKLIKNGIKELQKFDTYTMRAEKIIETCEKICK